MCGRVGCRECCGATERGHRRSDGLEVGDDTDAEARRDGDGRMHEGAGRLSSCNDSCDDGDVVQRVRFLSLYLSISHIVQPCTHIHY